MPRTLDPENIEIIRNDIKQKLNKWHKEGNTEGLISYPDISQAFPNGSHPDYNNVTRLNWVALSEWANILGWDVDSGEELAQSVPLVRFRRRKDQ